MDMGASTNKDEGDTEDKEEKKPGTCKNLTSVRFICKSCISLLCKMSPFVLVLQ